ncbi:MAG: hypothetical protein ACREJ0_22075, partial [Geminicoccaceae bacterium]
YFFAGDEPETRRLVEAIGAFFARATAPAPAGASVSSRFSPKPRQGSVEVWLPPADGAKQSA